MANNFQTYLSELLGAEWKAEKFQTRYTHSTQAVKPLQEPRRGQHCQNLVLGGASSSDALCVREWCSLNA